MTDYTKRLLGSAAMLFAAGTLARAQVVEIPASFAYPTNLVDTTAPGFVVRVVQADKTGGELPNSIARTEAQLAGVLVNEVTGILYTNVANLNQLQDDGVTPKFNPDGTYFETGGIDYHSGTFPGIPGLSDPLADITDPASFNNGDNFAVEALTYLVLQPGTYAMVVNSDDGFQVKVGPDARDQVSSIVLGTYDGGRGASDSLFQFHVSQAGAYSFRLIYEEGGGGYDLNWSTVDTNDVTVKTLVNAEGGIPAYRKISGGSPLVVDLLTPAAGAVGVSPAAVVTARIVDGTTSKLDTNSVKVYFDNVLVTAAISKKTNGTTISYDPPGLLKGLTKHTVGLVFADNSSPANVRSNSYSFTIANFGNVVLPAPIYFEDFESYAEGTLPTGWTVENYSTPGIEDTSPDDPLDVPGSTLFDNWLLITKDRVLKIGAAGRWDGARRVRFPAQFVNGQPIDGIVSNKFIYAESDTRGGSQVQYMFTKDYDLSGKTNLYVSYYSMYEQNQDSLGSTEYSIDGGATWLPIVYMIDGPDIVTDVDGNPDGYATFTKINSDTAADPLNPDGDRTYGAFIGAASNTWANLGPYISARVNDDSVESKRVELFPIPAAANQKTVRFRFAQGGTGSWYYGIDNLGIYSITTPILVAPKITAISTSGVYTSGQAVELSVAVSGSAPFTYQWSYNGAEIPGSTGTNIVFSSINATNSGKYTVVIRNDAGVASSSEINVSVVSADVDLKKDLVVHLKFEDNLSDASGRGNNGSAVGSITYVPGKIGGKAAVYKSNKDGSSFNYITLGSPSDLDFGQTTDFTVAFWAKLTAWTADPAFVGNKNWNSGSNPGYVIATDGDGRIQWNLAGKPDGSNGDRKDYDGPGGTFSDLGWHHIAVSFTRSGTASTYVDGTLRDTRAISTPPNNLSTPAANATNIGQDGTGSYTDGGGVGSEAAIDDLGIWRRALTADEVGAMYLKGTSGLDITTDPITVGLVGHYTFDGDFKDSSGRTNDGTMVGEVPFITGRIGSKAAVMKNTKETSSYNFVTLGNPADLNFGTDVNFSVAMWVKKTAWTSDPSFFGNKAWTSGSTVGYVIATEEDNRVQWNLAGKIGGGSGDRKDFDSAGGFLPVDQWHHIVVTFNRTGDASTYVDGALINSKSITTPPNDLTTPEGQATNIGQDGTGAYPDSASSEFAMDDVGVWRRALTAQDVATIYLRATNGKDLAGNGAAAPAAVTFAKPSITGNTITFTWSGPAATYQLQKASALGAAWTNAGTPVTGNSTTVTVDSGAAFYRLLKQ